MIEYTDHEKAVVLDEICRELNDTDWVQMWKSPSDDSWVVQIDGTIEVSEYTAHAIRHLMGDSDG